MPIRIVEPGHKVISIAMIGHLTDADYKAFVPHVEQAIAEEGKIRMLVDMTKFEGLDPHAVWDDFAFGIKHMNDLERVAVVGNRDWENWMTRISNFFSRADARYFTPDELEAARIWLREGIS